MIAPGDSSEVDIGAGAYTEHGLLMNSAEHDGLDFRTAFDQLSARFEAEGRGERKVNYRLRDWGVSRQRYWGTPVPMIHCEACGIVPVPEDQLPVTLPEDIAVDGVVPPLADMPSFYETQCPTCGGAARRDTDTFDTFMGVFLVLRPVTPAPTPMPWWMSAPTTGCPSISTSAALSTRFCHLLYARFYQRLMRDVGLAKADEPFSRLLTQGMVLKDGAKMSKSKGNTVDPAPLIETYGADTVRLFSVSNSPPDQSLEWSENGVQGAHRFLRKVWRLVYRPHAWWAGVGPRCKCSGR